ncbi:hypothetical protein ACJIZ3_025426 [Penstemon smallii]|uniref:Uncharacterized protein n=1 Tax=Penstemon smallii TaxID=265156 RepID=A0ABD3TX55_9LAMI
MWAVYLTESQHLWLCNEASKDDIIIPHEEPFTVETYLAWRERDLKQN